MVFFFYIKLIDLLDSDLSFVFGKDHCPLSFWQNWATFQNDNCFLSNDNIKQKCPWQPIDLDVSNYKFSLFVLLFVYCACCIILQQIFNLQNWTHQEHKDYSFFFICLVLPKMSENRDFLSAKLNTVKSWVIMCLI